MCGYCPMCRPRAGSSELATYRGILEVDNQDTYAYCTTTLDQGTMSGTLNNIQRHKIRGRHCCCWDGATVRTCARRSSTKQDQSEPPNISALSVLDQRTRNWSIDPVLLYTMDTGTIQKHAQETTTVLTTMNILPHATRSSRANVPNTSIRTVGTGRQYSQGLEV
jgi:hypothetical protein